MRAGYRAVARGTSQTGKASLSTTVARPTKRKANVAYLDATHTDDPSPATLDKLAKYASVTLNTYSRPPFFLTSGKGLKVWDERGREFLDFSGGIAVNALGHADEGVQGVMAVQSGKLVHNSNLYHNEWSGELAYLLVESTKRLGGLGFEPQSAGGGDKPASSHDSAAVSDASSKSVQSSGLKVFFTNSGTESNEGALKFVRKWGKKDGDISKTEIVSFANGFHGRSMGALSATWQEKYQLPFAPLLPDFVKGEINNIDNINEVVNEKTCGVIIEPIQGEGGIFDAHEDCLRALRKRCDEVGALLIFDEIQCGLGRTGNLWAHGSLPVDCHPDIVTMAKPLANGFPIGAILMKDKVANVIKIGDHGTTFGGGPLQTRVGHHVLSRIVEPSLLENVRARGDQLRARLADLPTLFPRLIAGPPRGRGLIQGLPFKRDDYVSKMIKLCRERGVLLLSCGKATVRFVPSLTVTEAEVQHCCDVLESCLVVLNGQAEGP